MRCLTHPRPVHTRKDLDIETAFREFTGLVKSAFLPTQTSTPIDIWFQMLRRVASGRDDDWQDWWHPQSDQGPAAMAFKATVAGYVQKSLRSGQPDRSDIPAAYLGAAKAQPPGLRRSLHCL